jgi:hypothetical protein
MARLGQLLVRADLVSENNLARALGIQHFAGGRVGTLLLERGSLDEDSLGKTLALQHGCEYIPWRVLTDVSAVAIAALPAKFAIKHAAVPYERGENSLKVALRDPGDLRILDELFFVTGRKIIAGVAPEVRIYQALEKYYGERRTPRYAILAEKLSRAIMMATRSAPGALPPPPEFFPESRRKPTPSPAQVWGDAVEPDITESPIIQSWKVPEQQIGGWAGTVSPGMGISAPQEPETISWEEMPAIPSMWLPEPEIPAEPAPPPLEAEGTPPPAEPAREPNDRTAWMAAAPESAASRTPPPPIEIDVPTAAARSRESSAPFSVPAQAPSPLPPVAAPAALPAHSQPEPAASTPGPEMPLVLPTAEREPARQALVPPDAPPAQARAFPEPPQPELQALAEPLPASPSPLPPAATASPAAPRAAVPSATDFPEVASALDRNAIASAALSALARRFLRGAVFVAKPDLVSAWGGAGDGVSPEELQDIAIPWNEPSIFLNVRLSRSFYLGPLPPLARNEAIAIAMGGWPDECLVQPILIKEKPVAFLYAEFARDQGATPMDLAYMRELASAASSAFVSAIRLRKKEI